MLPKWFSHLGFAMCLNIIKSDNLSIEHLLGLFLESLNKKI